LLDQLLQDLQKLARETSSVVDGKLQEQLAAAQAVVFAEQRRRADAEGEAQVWRVAGWRSAVQQIVAGCHLQLLPSALSVSLAFIGRCFQLSLCAPAAAAAWAQVQRAKAEQVQREVDRLQRSLAARDSLIQQLKAARMTDTPAREVGAPLALTACMLLHACASHSRQLFDFMCQLANL
jgi:hypothetical protein